MFRQALEARKRKICFWNRMRALLEICVITDWAALWRRLAAKVEPVKVEAEPHGGPRPEPQTGSVRPEMLESGSPGSHTKPRRHRRRRTVEAAHTAGGRGAARRRSRSRQFREYRGNRWPLTRDIAVFPTALYDAELDYGRVGVPQASNLPAVHWKLINLERLKRANSQRHKAQRDAHERFVQ